MRKDTVRFSISLPKNLLHELDERIIGQGYASRSELVRDLIRERIVEEKWNMNTEEVIGVLTIAFDHHNRDLLGRIVDAQHGHYVNTICSTHVHLDHDNCLEVIIIQGKAPDIEHLSTAIGGIRGVKFAKLTRTARLPV
jgi:CopG family nickel-responsive transcriptional regulator